MPRQKQAKVPTAAEIFYRFDDLPNAAYIDVRVVALVHDVSQCTVWRWVRTGKFPPPETIAGETRRWQVGVVRQRRASAA